MTSSELLMHESKSNEIAMLRGYVEKIAEMECAKTAWGESMPKNCPCPPCGARETLATVDVMQDMYSH